MSRRDWLVTGDGRAVYALNEEGTNAFIAQVSGPETVEVVPFIAEAPAMYEMLVELTEMFEDTEVDCADCRASAGEVTPEGVCAMHASIRDASAILARLAASRPSDPARPDHEGGRE